MSSVNLDCLISLENMENDTTSVNSSVKGDLRLHNIVSQLDKWEEIAKLIEDEPHLLWERNGEGGTPLHVLCKYGDISAPEIAKLLLGVRPDGIVGRKDLLNLEDDIGCIPLLYASRQWFPSLIKLFLECGADPKSRNHEGDTSLHFIAEGDSENALECARLILQYDDQNGTLINMTNALEVRPLHYAVKEKAVAMVNLLLDPLYKLDLESHENYKYILYDLDATEKSCEILKAILNSCSSRLLIKRDTSGQTILHLATFLGFPSIIEILVADPRVNVLSLDNGNMTALHYAAILAEDLSVYRCLEHLIDRKFDFDADHKHKIKYLYEMNDDMGRSPFEIACLNAAVSAVKKFLQAVPEPQFWMSESNMDLLYKKCPIAITVLMDDAFRYKDRNIEQDVMVVDFGPITGYVDPVEKMPQQETKYLKNVLWFDYDTQKEIFMHPLTQLFIMKKCQCLKVVMYAWILWQLMWLTAYTLLILTAYCNMINSETLGFVCAKITGVYILISSVNEIFEIISVRLLYFKGLSNWFQVMQIILAGSAVTPVLIGSELTVVSNNCAAVGILLAWILSMRDIGKLNEEIGLVVEILKQVVIQIVKVLLFCSPLLMGFMLAFLILFKDEESLNRTFPGPIVKVLVMMTGEYEYNAMFRYKEGESNNEDPSKNIAIRSLVFLSFLILVPISFFNLLTGFALDKVMELRERAKVGRIAKQLEHIHLIESMILSFSRLLKWFWPGGSYLTFLRQFNVTTVKDYRIGIGSSSTFDCYLKFHTFLRYETKEHRRTAKQTRRNLCSDIIPSIFGTQLSHDVRHQIIKLASQNSHPRQ